MKAAWHWLQRNAALVGSWLLSLGLAVLLAFNQRRGRSVDASLQAREHHLHLQVQALTQERNRLVARAQGHDQDVLRLQAEIERYQRSAVALSQQVDTLTHPQLEAAYRTRYHAWRQGTRP